MKKMFAWVMALALLLCAACGRQPEAPDVSDTPDQPPQQEQPGGSETPGTPESPETSEVPEVPDVSDTPQIPDVADTPIIPEVSDVPEEPEVPQTAEPEGAVASVMLPSNVIPDLGRLEQWLPLEENAIALRATREEEARVLIFDLVEQRVLAECQMPYYEKNSSTRQLSRLNNDPRTLLFYDGRDYWKLAADESWQLTAEEYDILQQSAKMGDHTVEQKQAGIAVDGVVPDGLKTKTDRVCTLTTILDDHRLLYQYTGPSVMDRHVGVYDHSTGEMRPLTTVGQQAWGVWGDTLLLVRGGGPVYDMGWVDLTDYTYTPLDIGHQTTTDRVDSALCNTDGTRLMVSWNDLSGSHVQVLDIETGEERYQWSAPTTAWVFYPMDDNGLIACEVADGTVMLWKVEY